MMLNKVKAFLVVLMFTLTTPSCAWWQKLMNDPSAALQEGTSYFRTALGLARSAFDIWAAGNPEQANNVRPQFNRVVGDVEQGLMFAQQTFRTSAQTRQPAPDSNELLHSAQESMGRVHDLLSGLPGPEPGRAVDSSMREALNATQRASQRITY